MLRNQWWTTPTANNTFYTKSACFYAFPKNVEVHTEDRSLQDFLYSRNPGMFDNFRIANSLFHS